MKSGHITDYVLIFSKEKAIAANLPKIWRKLRKRWQTILLCALQVRQMQSVAYALKIPAEHNSSIDENSLKYSSSDLSSLKNFTNCENIKKQ